VVISPTKALINEQSEKLAKLNVLVHKLTSDESDLATLINSNFSVFSIIYVQDLQRNKLPAFIYTTPEKMVQHKLFYDNLRMLYDKGNLFTGMCHWCYYGNVCSGY
jgi:ATP-dependent helicase YprA (DUF1998 family)